MKKKILLEAKNKVGNALYEYFGDELVSQKQGYKANERDLMFVFQVVNKYVFESNLKMNFKLSFEEDDGTYKAKGYFGFLTEINGKLYLRDKPFILIIREKTDTMINVISTFCHELIHYADYTYGDLKTEVLKHKDDFGKIKLRYNGHKGFFEKYIDIFANYAIPISVYSYRNMRYFMIKDELTEADKTKDASKEKSNRLKAQKYAKALFDAVHTSEFISVEAVGNKVYFVMS